MDAETLPIPSGFKTITAAQFSGDQLEDEDDDPLEAYCRLVKWTMESYPEGHNAESGLLELLEEATRVLKDHRDGRWRGEMKYLQLWLHYTSFVNKPTTIYKFLLANEIGTQFALLYEEYAAVLERDGRCVVLDSKTKGLADDRRILQAQGR